MQAEKEHMAIKGDASRLDILLEKRPPRVAQGSFPDQHLPPIPAHADMHILRIST